MSRRSKIFEVLTEVYGDSSFARSVNEFLSDGIDRYINEGGVHYSWGTYTANLNEVRNKIWMNWPGGSTAEYAADKLNEFLNLPEYGERLRNDERA